ncbi:MAG: MATE family efflux transporter [Planctomycetes bacterium]|nr:MATE family efflux transporter [Planctomycetota bacterium]
MAEIFPDANPPPPIGMLPPGSPGGVRQLLGLAIPAAGSTVSFTIMLFVDAYFVGKLGVAELGGVGLAGTFYWMATNLFMGTLGGIHVFVSQLCGSGQGRRSGEYAAWAPAIALAAWAVLVALALALPSILAQAKLDPGVRASAVAYLQVRLAGSVFSLLNAGAAALFEGSGDTRTTMAVNLFSNALNACLDWILVLGNLGVPALGVRGAALATVASTAVGTGIYAWRIARRRFRSRLLARPPRLLDPRRLAELVRVGGPTGLAWTLESVSWTVFIFLVASLGAETAGGQHAAVTWMHLAFMPGVGVGTATTVIVGQYVGAGALAIARRGARSAYLVLTAYMVSVGLVFFFFRRPLISFFTEDERAIAIGSKILIFAALWQLFDSLAIVSFGALRGAGDTVFPLVAGAILAWGFFLPGAYIAAFPLGAGATGAWGIATAFVCLYGAVMGLRWRSDRWTRIRVGRTG